MKKIIKPSFIIDIEDYEYIGRGAKASSGSSGWNTGTGIYYRCVSCGDFMEASINKYFSCRCGAMSLDYDYGRFGSRFGDNNILVYRKKNK